MRNDQDMIGRRFGKLIVISREPSDPGGRRRWLCRCDCGGVCTATTGNLNSGRTTNCGCRKSPDLTGMVFGRLTVLGRSDRRGSRGRRTTPQWECRCECGAITYKATDSLKSPHLSMCAACAAAYAASGARAAAGFVEGTQLSKIRDMTPGKANTSGYRGVYHVKRHDYWRAEIRF